MLDRKYIVENADAVKQNCIDRGVAVDVFRFVVLENARKTKQARIEQLNREANEVSRSIGSAKSDAERETQKRKGRELRTRLAEQHEDLDMIAAELDTIHRVIPNVTHPDVPVGGDDKANRELFKGKARD